MVTDRHEGVKTALARHAARVDRRVNLTVDSGTLGGS